MRVGRPRITMDCILWVSTTFGVLIGSRLLSLAIPSEYYFTFQSLFSDRPPQAMVLAILGRMLDPFLVGLITGWILDITTRQTEGPSRHASFGRRLRQRWSPSVFVGAFSAAFVSAWPMIVYWDLLANPEVTHLKVLFFVLYLIYMFAYGYVALLGLLVAVFLRERMADDAARKTVSVRELTRIGAIWLLNSGIASAMLTAITK